MASTYHGKPCPNGHTERYSSSQTCVQCARDRYKDPAIRAREAAHMRKWRAKKEAQAVVPCSVPGWGFLV